MQVTVPSVLLIENRCANPQALMTLTISWTTEPRSVLPTWRQIRKLRPPFITSITSRCAKKTDLPDDAPPKNIWMRDILLRCGIYVLLNISGFISTLYSFFICLLQAPCPFSGFPYFLLCFIGLFVPTDYSHYFALFLPGLLRVSMPQAVFIAH